MIKNNMIVVTILLFLIGTAVFAQSGSVPVPREAMLNKWFYLRYSHGVSIYLTDVKNGYVGLTDTEIRAGMTFQPELGVCIKNKLQLGISYLYMDGIAELDGGVIGLLYDDVFFSGAAFKARYFLIDRKKIRFPIGIEAAAGECTMFSGYTDNRNQMRGIGQGTIAWLNSYRYFRGRGYGGAVSGSFVYQPFTFLSIGFDAIVRIIVSEKKMEQTQGVTWMMTEALAEELLQSYIEDFSFKDDYTVKLNFTSLNFNAFVSFHF